MLAKTHPIDMIMTRTTKEDENASVEILLRLLEAGVGDHGVD